MEIKKFQLVEMSSYSPKEGYRKWYEFQPQYSDEIVYINLENVSNNGTEISNIK